MKFLSNNKKEIILGSVVALVLVIFLQKLFIIATIPSESMENLITKGDKVFVKTYDLQINRDKIYTFTKDNSYLIKRCIGLGGDHIQVKGDKVYRNGTLLKEDYVSSTVSESDKSIDIDVVVPEGKLFFLGDNRKVSYDSRFWEDKFVPEENVIGEATYIIYPFSRLGEIE